MNTESIALMIAAALWGAMSIFLFVVSYRQHKEKGFIFTNHWLFASKKEREAMDERIKKSEYRVGRNVFFLLGLMSMLLAIQSLGSFSWLLYLIIALMVIACVYSIYQYITNERLHKSINEDRVNKQGR